MALPPEPTSDAPSASDPNDLHLDGIDADLTSRIDSLYWDFESWTATRADDVELFSILASGSGPEWRRKVQEAQRNGETLPLRTSAPKRER